MTNISWLESIAMMTDHDREINEILKTQPIAIQMAYRSNDNLALNMLLGGSDRLAYKKTVFQL